MSPSVCDLVAAALPAPTEPVLVVTGIAREARIAAGPGVETLCSGGVPAQLRASLAARAEPCCRAIVSFGVAGGLDPELRPGDIVIATKVVAGMEEWAVDPLLLEGLLTLMGGETRVKILQAPIAGVDVALVDALTKRSARDECGAAAVDMESHIAADYAARNGVPFGAIRVICDPAHRGLPPLVTTALTASGSISLPGVFGSLARRPGQIVDLWHLANDAKAAFRALAQAGALWRQTFPGA